MRSIRICRYRPSPLRSRRRLGPLAGIALALALGIGPCRADGLPSLAVVDYGLYGPSPTQGPLPARYPQDTPAGVRLTGLPPLLAQTDRIIAAACTRFGLEFWVDGGDAGLLTVSVQHPPLQRPGGEASTSDSFAVPLDPGLHFAGFDFDAPWERVGGDWTFTLIYRGRTLAEQRFHVTPAPDEAGGCRPPIA